MAEHNKNEVTMSQQSTLQAPRQGLNLRRFLDEWVMLLAALAIFALCAGFIDNFLSPLNMRGLGLAISTTGIAACTMLYCLASGHFDLSVGSVIACAGVIAAVVMRDTGSVGLGIAAALAMGLVVGLINGIVIAKLRINALIATLATMQIVRGLAYIFSNGKAVGVSQEQFFVFGNGQLFGVPVPILITVVCFLFFGWLLNYTTYGRNTMAIGGNQEAALLAGVQVDRTKIIIFAVHGLIGALAGVVLASRMTSGQPMIGQGFELTVISACVLGGVSLAGGIGMIRHVIAGVLILAIIENAMNLKNIDTFYQYVIRGTILLIAVIIDRMKRR
jgi:L-arabinose transport system permease protein